MNIQSRFESDFSVRQRRAVQIQVKISIKLKLSIRIVRLTLARSQLRDNISDQTESAETGNDSKTVSLRFASDNVLPRRETRINACGSAKKKAGVGRKITAHRFILGNRNCKLSSRRNLQMEFVHRWSSDETFFLAARSRMQIFPSISFTADNKNKTNLLISLTPRLSPALASKTNKPSRRQPGCKRHYLVRQLETRNCRLCIVTCLVCCRLLEFEVIRECLNSICDDLLMTKSAFYEQPVHDCSIEPASGMRSITFGSDEMVFSFLFFSFLSHFASTRRVIYQQRRTKVRSIEKRACETRRE